MRTDNLYWSGWSNRLSLLPGTIHVWCVNDTDIEDADLLNRYYLCLDDKEKQKQARFYHAGHRHQYLIAHALVRTVLSLYVDGVSAEEWIFNENKYGRPYIANPGYQHIKFNLSHTDGLITLAITLQYDVGVDAEWSRLKCDVLEIASGCFSPEEYGDLILQPHQDQLNRFFDLWTLKEAYIKACGMGLSIPLDHFSFSFDDRDKISIKFISERKDQSELWQFWQLRYSSKFKIAIAVKSNVISKPFDLVVKKAIPLLRYKELKCEVFRRSGE